MAQLLAVSAGVEVEGVHQVFPRHRVGGGLVDVLAPGGGADEDNAFGGLGPDGGDQPLGVGLHVSRPGHVPVGLVADFIQHVGRVLVPLRRRGEKALRRRHIGHGVSVGEDVPVQNGVQIGLDGGVHRGEGPLRHGLRLAEIAPLPRIHGHPEHVGPIGRRVGHGLGGGILAVPLQAVGAHAVEDNGLSPLIAQLGSNDLEPAVLRHAPFGGGNRGDGRPLRLRGRLGRYASRGRQGPLKEGAGLRPGEAVQRAKVPRPVPGDHSGGAGGQGGVIIAAVEGGKILDLSGFRSIVIPFAGQKGLHQHLYRQLAGDGLIPALPGGGQLVPVVPACPKGGLHAPGGPVAALAPGRLQPGAPGGDGDKFCGGNGVLRVEAPIGEAL